MMVESSTCQAHQAYFQELFFFAEVTNIELGKMDTFNKRNERTKGAGSFLEGTGPLAHNPTPRIHELVVTKEMCSAHVQCYHFLS